MASAELRINPLFAEDLKEIIHYEDQKNGSKIKSAALINEIIDKIQILTDFPEIGPSLSRIIKINTDYRYLIVGSYIIFYRYDRNVVKVNRVFNAKRDYLYLLFDQNDSAAQSGE